MRRRGKERRNRRRKGQKRRNSEAEENTKRIMTIYDRSEKRNKVFPSRRRRQGGEDEWEEGETQ